MTDLASFITAKRKGYEKEYSSDESDVESSSSCSEAEDSEAEERKYRKGGYHCAKINDKINGYEITERIGRGHFGSVWKCKKKNQFFAMKIQKSSKSYRIAAEEEELIHKHLRKGDGFGKKYINCLLESSVFKGPFGSHKIFIFPLMDMDLAKFISKADNDRLGLETTSQLAYQTLAGISYVHENDIIHTDIKPENILIKEEFKVQLADFGTACAVGDRENNYVQTCHYRSPDILLEYRHWSTPIDIWSLACVYYECIVGEYLFNGDIEEDLILSMIEILGRPQPRFLDDCRAARKYFNREYRFRNQTDINPLPLHRILGEIHEFSYDDSNAICRLLQPMLAFHPDDRWKATRLLDLYPQEE